MAVSSFLTVSVIVACVPAVAVGLAVMSIDFGNEYMKIAIVKPGVPMEIVLNKESLRKTPTAITLKDNEKLVGDPALSAAIRSPKQSYRYLLDVLGKDFDNPLVQLYHKRFPYYDMEKDPETGTVLFKHEGGALYSPEELVAMILEKAKEYAETFAEQPINEAVITVPPFFNQAERRAMLRAADLAGLRVLQLINDNTAVALNYGVFRRKIFNATAVHYMFFDIGASGTSATIVAYQILKTKSPTSGVVDTYPQLTIKGIGFDRTLGGMEFQLRLRDFLADHFNKVKKSKNDVRSDIRSMMKLYKEAGRLKQVLSANADHFGQVESLFEDEDFRVKVTREEFENLCQDLVDRVDHVVKDALTTAQLSMDDIEEVILMGGGTRIPKVQQAIMKAIGREELGKGINTDEAAALGAVYQAAHLGKGFKVKKFAIKEATLYPIVVEFERAKSKDDELSDTKSVKRVLFGHMQQYPQKKVITFNKHVSDFDFEVKYGELKFMSEEELSEFGNTRLQTVSLTGVADAHETHSKDSEPKGIKAHFRVDDSGILHLDKVEATFEKTVEVPVVVEEEESTLSKIGNTISSLFGGGSKSESKEDGSEESKDDQEKDIDDAEGNETRSETITPETPPETKQEQPSESEESSSSASSEKQEEAKEEETKEEQTETKLDEQPERNETTAEEETKAKTVDDKEKQDAAEKPAKDESKKIELKKKTTVVHADIKAQTVLRDMPDPSVERLKQSKKLLAELKKIEEEIHLLSKVKNEIESFVFDVQDKLERREYKLCSTEDERVTIAAKMSEASDWLMEQEDNTPRKEYEKKLKDLKTVTRSLFERVKEMSDRPTAIAQLAAMVNHTEYFLAMMKNFTGEDLPYTQAEYDALDRLINETKDWNKTMIAEQAKTPLTEDPKFTVEDVGVKYAALDRELKYLVNKMKSYRPPKPKPKPTKDTNATEGAASNETKTKNEETKVPSSDKEKTPEGEVPIVDTETEKTPEQPEVDKLDRDILEEDTTSRSEDKSSSSDPEKKSQIDDEL